MPPSSPSWVGGFSPPGPAQAKAEGRELFPAHVHARSCWQGCPPQAHCSRALCQHCQPTSMGTCGVLAAHPKTAQAFLAERLLLSWCHLYITGEPAQACALCSGLRQDPAVPAASPLRAFGPMTGHGAVPPLPGALPTPVPPQSQWDGDLPEQAQLATEGRGCVCLGLGVGVGAGAGLLGWVRSVPWRFVSPAPCPDTQPQAFVGIRK